MTDEITNSKTSIEQLYQNRKQQYKMPESLQESLRESLTKSSQKKSYQQLRYFAPVAFASVLAVIFIWPNKSIVYSPEKVFYSSIEDASNLDLSSAPKPKTLAQSENRSIENEEIETEQAIMAESLLVDEKVIVDNVRVASELVARSESSVVSQSKKKAEVPSKTPVSKPVVSFNRKAKSATPVDGIMHEEAKVASKDSSALIASMAAEVDDSPAVASLAAAPMAAELTAVMSIPETKEPLIESVGSVEDSITPSLASNNEINSEPMNVKVIDGDKGVFETCKGDEIELPVKTELLGWVAITRVDSSYVVEHLLKFECEKSK